MAKLSSFSVKDSGNDEKTFWHNFFVVFEISCRDFFSWQYLILLSGVIAIVLALYPGGLQIEFKYNVITSNHIKDCW